MGRAISRESTRSTPRTAWSWRAIFFINAPIGLAALAALPLLRRRGITDSADRAARFDPVGLLLLSAGLAGASYGANRGACPRLVGPSVMAVLVRGGCC